jgi:hypothetical protein
MAHGRVVIVHGPLQADIGDRVGYQRRGSNDDESQDWQVYPASTEGTEELTSGWVKRDGEER